MRLEVDASDVARKLVKARIIIPARPGPMTLFYPKWLPGEHAPTGPIVDVAGLKLAASGKPLAWQRDDVDMYAIHCTVPDGATEIEVSLDFLSSEGKEGFTSAASSTPKLAVIQWNQVLVYPSGQPTSQILCIPSLRLPDGWKLGTALKIASQDSTRTTFAPVSVERLVDSPVLCGAFFREVPIGPAGSPPHFVEMASDSEAALEMSPEVKASLDRLVAETGALFGARHYESYRFLLTMSDHVAHFGLEHHESSDDRTGEDLLSEDKIRKTGAAGLLPHEFFHSWNGKHRRPADMVTENFQQPHRTKLLWVYEGLTDYYGVVLSARCGLWNEQQFRDSLAMTGEWARNQQGRTWRPLEDTAVAAQLLYESPRAWSSWRRSVDFYGEGALLWLEVDTIIRQQTNNNRSLDDFCRNFFGGEGGGASVKPYTFDDIVAGLNAVTPYDWNGLLTRRVRAVSDDGPLDGITRGGWKLTYSDKPCDLEREGEEDDEKNINLTASLGLTLKRDGSVIDVIPGKPAFRAGVGPGMKVVAVNSRRCSSDVIKNAVAQTKTAPSRLELLLENGEFFKTVTVDYQGGEKYPHLERDDSKPDLIASIIKPRAVAK